MPCGNKEPLAEWFLSDSGRALIHAEQAALKPLNSQCYGESLLQLGSYSKNGGIFSDSAIQRKYIVTERDLERSALISNYHHLPFESESVSAVILHHVVEFNDAPHALLREIARVLEPRGELFIISFNPLSLHGLYSLFAKLRPHSPWQQNGLTLRRLQDWLKLLGITPVQHRYLAHNLFPSLNQWSGWLPSGADKLTQSLPCGGVFLLHAIKEVAPLTPTRVKWQQPIIAPLGIKPPVAGAQQPRNQR